MRRDSPDLSLVEATSRAQYAFGETHEWAPSEFHFTVSGVGIDEPLAGEKRLFVIAITSVEAATAHTQSRIEEVRP